jgi:nucleotide-binding universal stress UspA family protein
VFLNILVAFDGTPPAKRALEHAVDLARAMNSMLTLILVAPQPAQSAAVAGISSERMRKELDDWARRLLGEATAELPDDVIAHTVQRTGDAGPEIVKELERGSYDLIVLGSRARGKARERLLGSVNGYVHFHSKVPLLSVPENSALV